MRRSPKLLHQSLKAFTAFRSLWVFPIIAALANLALLSVILTPIHRYAELQQPLSKMQWVHFAWLYVLFLIFLFLAHQIIFFFNAAIIDFFHRDFAKQPKSSKHSLRIAIRCAWRLYLWNQLAATVGIVLTLFHAHFREYKSINKLLAGQHWVVASQLVLPLIVIEGKRPIAALRESAALITNTWGAPVTPRFSHAFWITIVRILAMLPFFIALLIGGKLTIIIGSYLSVFGVMLLTLLNSSSRAVLFTALYWFSKKQVTPPDFAVEELQNAYFKRSIK